MAEPGVRAAADDGVVTLAPRPAGGETEVGHGGQLELHDPGLRAPHSLRHRQGGQAARDTQQVEFSFAFDQPQTVEQRREVSDGHHREAVLEALNEPRLACRSAVPWVRARRGRGPEELVAHGPRLFGRAQRCIAAEVPPLENEPLQVEGKGLETLDEFDTGEPDGFFPVLC